MQTLKETFALQSVRLIFCILNNCRNCHQFVFSSETGRSYWISYIIQR